MNIIMATRMATQRRRAKKVKKAQETIRLAEIELERTVKEYLETAESIRVDFDKPLSKTEIVDFTHTFLKDGLTIYLRFRYWSSDGDYDYTISCKEYGIQYHEPHSANSRTAQGTINVTYGVNTKDGIKKVTEPISLKKYYK